MFSAGILSTTIGTVGAVRVLIAVLISTTIGTLGAGRVLIAAECLSAGNCSAYDVLSQLMPGKPSGQECRLCRYVLSHFDIVISSTKAF